MANFDSDFFSLVFPGFQATRKIHAQNSRPELSAFLSNFTFSNPIFFSRRFSAYWEIKEHNILRTKRFYGRLGVSESNRHLMAHQMQNLCVFSVFHCVEGAFDASYRGNPK